MKKEFVPRYLSIKLKDIGYNQKVFAWSDIYNDFIFYMYPTNENNMNQYEDVISIPTFSQAFRWFREKGYDVKVQKESDGLYFGFYWTGAAWIIVGNGTHEEAELACLEKLIEIVESKSE
jgi:hypothetical protein